MCLIFYGEHSITLALHVRPGNLLVSDSNLFFLGLNLLYGLVETILPLWRERRVLGGGGGGGGLCVCVRVNGNLLYIFYDCLNVHGLTNLKQYIV